MTKISVQWSDREPGVEVSTPEELVRVLDDVAAALESEYPSIVFVDCHGHRAGIGLGRGESFVHIEQESGDPPYMITAGDTSAVGVVPFYLLGTHHTEIERRHLIPVEKARAILSEWVQTATRPRGVKWEEI